MIVHIKVLGAGCASCHTLEDRTNEALTQLGADGTVEMVTDYIQIAGYGVMSTPALVVDDRVVFSGRVPKVAELMTILAGTGS